jgi:succinate dehydrogenase flavin-adding protein (antitoxin of CptAB toxin-antitoxin module)
MDADYISKLKAIFWQCDRGATPTDLSAYTTFAAQVIAAMPSSSQKAITSLNL